MSPKSQPSRKHTRKGENPIRIPPIKEPCSGSKWSSTRICRNSACRAVLSTVDRFCKRCSCCICHLFDNNKDPSLWLECTSDSPCGSSCHIECALHRGKVGVIDLGQLMQLDGSYCCASCGKISGILGYWKKQLTIAKDSQHVDDLCYRIYLSFRLLDGTSKFKDLHEIVKEAKIKLETEVGPLNGVFAKMSRGSVSRLSVAGDVQELCNAAIQKADKLSAILSSANLDGKGHSEARCFTSIVDIPHKNLPDATVPHNEGTAGEPDSRFEVPDLGRILRLTWVGERGNLDEISGADFSGLGQTVNPDTSKADALPFTSHGPDLKLVRVPDLNEGVVPNDSCRDEADHGSGGSENWDQYGPNGEVPAVDFRAGVSRKRPAITVADGCNRAFPFPTCRGGPGNLDDNYEHCVKTIRSLECQGYLEQEFRKKLLTWYSLWSTEQERRVVNTFIQTLVDDPRSLARQLVDSFAYIMNSKRS
ncbi:hypothetical protein SSX86_020169 [Deinandra increscens subsp. villosa]|uniref:Oberon PHD finger domain-containing protein n=1 Tax=Deinandra increscens subsp. villosa TaxID=3103831 RepID=A0AAP0CSM2_9ASTR